MQTKSCNELFALGLAFFVIVSFLSMDMYLPALPTIARELHLSQDMAQYTVTLWFLGSASTQLIIAPIADHYGRKQVFLAGIGVFILASIGCALSTHYYTLLISRLLQGATLCSTMVAGYATIHAIFSGRRAIQVMAILSSITILAPALGPIFGAYILLRSSWHMIFYLLAGMAAFACIWHSAFMPVIRHEQASLAFRSIFRDYARIFSNRQFMQLLCANCLLTSAFFMWVVESPFIIISHLQLGEMMLGKIQIPIFSGFIIGGQLTRYYVQTCAPKRLVDVGMAIALLGVVSFAWCGYLQLGVVYCVVAMMVLSIGASMTFGPLSRFVIESSNAPMASRVAVQSLATSICGVFASTLVTLVNNMTFFHVSLPMTAAVVASICLFMTSQLPQLAEE